MRSRCGGFEPGHLRAPAQHIEAIQKWRYRATKAGVVVGPSAVHGIVLLAIAPKLALTGATAAAFCLAASLTLASRIYRWIDALDGDIDTASDLLDYSAFGMSACASVVACIAAAGGWGGHAYSPIAAMAHGTIGALLLAFPRRFRIFCGGYSTKFELMRGRLSSVCDPIRRDGATDIGA